MALAVGVTGASSTAAAAAVPRVNHVFIVVLENENAGSTFGPNTQIPYLAKTLTSKGAYVPNYYATGHLSLDNYISMVSGQAPNLQTQADCQLYTDFSPGLPTSDGQLSGRACNDGHDELCADGQPGGMVQANSFLESLVPQILASPAYKDHGLLIVTFDEAEAEPGTNADASACCNERPGPNTINPGGLVPGPGGGRIGAVMVSPCIQPSTVSFLPYNHYSLLRSIEDNFGLSHLGYAGQSGLRPFNVDILNNPGCPMKRKKCKTKRRRKHGHHAPAAKKKHKDKKCKRKKRPKRQAVT